MASQMQAKSFAYQPDIKVNDWEFCKKAKKFWCGDDECCKRHTFDICQQFLTTMTCHLKEKCMCLHIFPQEDEHHREYGVLTDALKYQIKLKRQIVGVCRKVDCKGENYCRNKHYYFEQLREDFRLRCVVCDALLVKFNMVIYTDCDHVVCETCYDERYEHCRLKNGGNYCPLCDLETFAFKVDPTLEEWKEMDRQKHGRPENNNA